MHPPIPAALIYKWLSVLESEEPGLRPLSALLALWRFHHGRDDWASPRRYGLVAGCIEALGLRWELWEVSTAVIDATGERPLIAYGRDEDPVQSVQMPYFLLRIPELAQVVDLAFPDLPAVVAFDPAPVPFWIPVPDGPLEATMMFPRGDRVVAGYMPMRAWSDADAASLADFEEARGSALVEDLLAEVIDVLRWSLAGFTPEEGAWGSLTTILDLVEGTTLRTVGRPRPVFVSGDGVERTMGEILQAV